MDRTSEQTGSKWAKGLSAAAATAAIVSAIVAVVSFAIQSGRLPASLQPYFVVTSTAYATVNSTVTATSTATATVTVTETEEVTTPATGNVNSGPVDRLIPSADFPTVALMGRLVGPQTYQMEEFGDDPQRVDISAAWEGRLGGSAVESNSCSISTWIVGPNRFESPRVRSASCTQDHLSPFSNGDFITTITAPGTYTLVVKDNESDTTGRLQFEVVS